MNCPYCNTAGVPARGRCSACGRSLPSGVQVAAGLLTPLPIAPIDIDRDEMTIAGPLDAATILHNERTIVGDVDAARMLGANQSSVVARSTDDDLPRGFTPDVPQHRSASSDVTEPTGPLTVGQAFGSRYHVIRVLGIGGMGAVYHAWDAELAMAVALKVIRPEANLDPEAAREMERRFKQELVLARQVTHKNVVRIHDLGEINGIKYITMPYLEGSDLATTLKQQGKMPVPAALRIVRDVAAGLAAAHEAGIVHRDLKPANIMVLSDHAVIMDFGIARSASRVDGGGSPQPSAPRVQAAAWQTQMPTASTVVGTILGTIQYMAPEQYNGVVVDQRADIYALGLIFSDMLLGKRLTPPDEDAFAELLRRVEKAPSPVRTLDATVPEAIDRLIARCLEPDPAARFQTSGELVAELDRLDENGEPIPIKRVVRLPFVVTVVALLLALSAGTWWYFRSLIPPVEHAPVSVLIADFQNKTNDPAFDRTLEPTLRLALEGAGFISAYDRTIINRIGVPPPELLDERVAQEIAVKQGVGVVLAGSVTRQGRGYTVAVHATQPVTGEVIATAQDTAPDKNQVLAVATGLATSVREALGDDTSDSAQRFAMETLTTTSLDAVRDYAMGQEALSNNRWEEARQNFAKAVQRDPNFGAAYSGMAITSRNLGQLQDSEKYAREAVRHLDRMTERERYRARGLLYYLTSDYRTCVKEYSDLITRYAGDAAARNNLALCLTYLRDMTRARAELRQVIKILPRRALYHYNLALYSSYGGDPKSGEEEAKVAQQLGSGYALGALAFAQTVQGQLPQAASTYQQLGMADDTVAKSWSASGLADLAAYGGRFSDAVRVLEQGAAADVKAKNLDRAAAKFATIAHVRLQQGRTAAAIAAADNALKNSTALKIRFLAARVFAEGGQIARARTLAASLAAEAPADPQTLAKIIEADIALNSKNPQLAIKLLTEANAVVDTWIGHFDLGRANLEANLLLQADSEFDRCIKRQGEALSLFLDEEPTYAFFPLVLYYQGRVREGLKSEGFADSYRTYLAIRGGAGEDPLLPEVRRRAGVAR